MKHTLSLILLYCIISFHTHAQKERISYEPWKWQNSLRIGLINTSLNTEYRLGAKTMVSLDAGIGMNYIQSHYYNKYNQNYHAYNEYFDDFFNFGMVWTSPFVSLQIKQIINTRSRKIYNTAPYSNTFTYYGFQMKYNGSAMERAGKPISNASFRETYQFAALFGRQIALNKKGNNLLDFHTGIGLLCNYKWSTVTPKPIIGARLVFAFLQFN